MTKAFLSNLNLNELKLYSTVDRVLALQCAELIQSLVKYQVPQHPRMTSGIAQRLKIENNKITKTHLLCYKN